MDDPTLLEITTLTPDAVAAKQAEIYRRMLGESQYLDCGNFTILHPDDLALLFDLYDESFFDGGCRKALGKTPLSFRLSKRMTRSGGMTTRRQRRQLDGQLHTEYEISVATTLLFQTFQEDHRPIVVTGLRCSDRLESLQRITEHEITHLLEWLIWNKSSCAAPRFQSIANRFFGHTEHVHRLITPRERALTKFGVKPGDRVRFRLDGQHYVGRVNRITKRATVLVENARGHQYSDGKRYLKFYIPVGMLETAGD